MLTVSIHNTCVRLEWDGPKAGAFVLDPRAALRRSHWLLHAALNARSEGRTYLDVGNYLSMIGVQLGTIVLPPDDALVAYLEIQAAALEAIAGIRFPSVEDADPGLAEVWSLPAEEPGCEPHRVLIAN